MSKACPIKGCKRLCTLRADKIYFRTMCNTHAKRKRLLLKNWTAPGLLHAEHGAGTLRKDGRVQLSVGGKLWLRARYVFTKANGNIPVGYEVHHDDENKVNDSLGNLVCMPMHEHRILHGRNARGTSY